MDKREEMRTCKICGAECVEREGKLVCPQCEYAGEFFAEKPFDVFITYRESENNDDLYEVSDIHLQLFRQKYHVFFAPISLRDKNPVQQKQVIFYALKTAKVMLVYGTNAEDIEALLDADEVQLHREKMKKREKQKGTLLLLYKKIQPLDLPEATSELPCFCYGSVDFYPRLFSYLQSFSELTKEEIRTSDAPEIIAPKPIAFTPLTAAKREEQKAFTPIHVHTYQTKNVPATCITQGYTLHYCECGHDYKTNYTPLVDHRYSLSTRVLASCNAEGQDIYVCSVCGETNTQYLPKAEHVFGEWIVQKYPTCDEEGTQARQCVSCGAIETMPIPAEGHTYGEWIWQRNPTCTEEGEEARQCTKCGDVDRRSTPPTGHKLGKWKRSKSNRREDERRCENCDYVETRPSKIGETERKKKLAVPFLLLTFLFAALGGLFWYLFYGNGYCANGYLTLGAAVLALICISVSVDGFRATGKFGGFKNGMSIIMILALCGMIIGNAVITLDSKKAVYKEGFLLEEGESGYTVVSASKFGDEFSVPESSKGKDVVALGDEAFSSCKKLTRVTIPVTVRKIGKEIFGDGTGTVQVLYQGTTEDWDAIDKDARWSTDAVVVCTDGELTYAPVTD